MSDGSKYERTQDGGAGMATENGRPHPGESDASVSHESGHLRPVRYLVLPSVANPFLLARVRWPDIYQAISPVRTDWQDDPGLFDLPYSPGSVQISYEQAAEIASGWGAEVPPEEADQPGATLIRRMPADWTDLSTAERRAWSIEIEKSARQELAAAAVRSMPILPEAAPAATPRAKRRWLRRRPAAPALVEGLAARADPIDLSAVEAELVIDLTEPADARATADFA